MKLASTLAHEKLDELIVADSGLGEEQLLEIVDAAHRRGVSVRVAPRTTDLLVERGEYVPGQGLPLFELRPPILAGADWAVKRAFDVVVAALIVVIGLPLWLLIALLVKATSRGPVFYSAPRIGLGEQPFRMLKFRTMFAGRRGAPGRARGRERGDRRALQDPRRPARHARRPRSSAASRSTRCRT